MASRKLTLNEAAAQLSDAYYLLFETEHGKMVLMDLTKKFGKQTFVPGEPDTSAFKAGSREVLLYIDQVRKRNDNFNPEAGS